MADPDPDRPVSQTVRAQVALRGFILSGRFRPGDRVTELQAVEITGVSRTPVRMALVRLEEEGLLEAIPSGGFVVRSFSESDILETIEIRGTLEGLAARYAAERGASARELSKLKHILVELDALLSQEPPSPDLVSEYAALNARFHVLLSDLSDSAPIQQMVERAAAMPFASPNALFGAQMPPAELRQTFRIAQDHHHIVVDAIENREGSRAEAVMREHARLTARNLREVLRSRGGSNIMPVLALVRPPTG